MTGKKLLVSIAMVIALLLCGWGIGSASISGVCSNCHTMHNSQNGAGEVETYSEGSLSTAGTTPQDQLLKASCIACHTGRRSCFYQRLEDGCWVTVEPVLKDPASIYGKG